MASDDRGRAAEATPPKAIGMGAPTSMWIYFEIAEIPALLDAIADELARYGGAARIDGRTIEPEAGVDPRDRRYHVGELQRMLGDVEHAADTRAHGRFDVLWPTVMAHGVVHAAVRHADRRAAAASSDEQSAAREALAAARRTLRDFEAVDNGGLDAVWL
jgi:hypothetical protein